MINTGPQPDLECTYWFEGWWHHCCVAHDLGGSDIELFSCVVNSSPNILAGLLVGIVMFVGVTIWRVFLKRKDVK